MTHSLVKTFALFGLDGHEVTIEADANKALPTIEIIGLPDMAVKEAKERLRSTFRNLDISIPPQKIVLNLAPSDIKKTGTQFDLPMAVAVLFLFCGHICHVDMLSSSLFFGELGLDGSVRRVQGLLPAVLASRKLGYTTFFVPEENVFELQYVNGIKVFPLATFRDIVDFFVKGKMLNSCSASHIRIKAKEKEASVDLSSIRGHLVAKRALCLAAAGGHNMLMVGPPGSGKTLLAQALASILPPLSFDEMIEVSQIYSLVGRLTKDEPLISTRPFRAVHHTASKIAITGGGPHLHPGEISLAHKGVLFFDELTEFPRESLEVLRQPLEEKQITISRAAGSVKYPAECMFVAAMNPCRCGYYKDREKPCSCSLAEIARYQSKISGPLLDRIDIVLEIPRESIETIFEKAEQRSSISFREEVRAAWERQQSRYRETTIASNASLSAKTLSRYVQLDEKTEAFMKQAAQRLSLSTRLVHRSLKLARTIADVEQKENVLLEHVAEALQYRSKNMFVEQR